MASAPPGRAPVQKFHPNTGLIVGYLGLGATVVSIVLVAVTSPGLEAVRVCLGLALLAVVIWVVLLRPRAAAYDDTLVLRHMLSDTHLPLARIDEVVVRQSLNVWVGDHRHVCAGIGRSTRSLLSQGRSRDTADFGLGRVEDRIGAGPMIGDGADYATFVETRILDLARSARRGSDAEPPAVRREWALPEILALAGLGVAFLVSLLV